MRDATAEMISERQAERLIAAFAISKIRLPPTAGTARAFWGRGNSPKPSVPSPRKSYSE